MKPTDESEPWWLPRVRTMLARRGACALVHNGKQVTPHRRPPDDEGLAQLIGWYTAGVDEAQLLADVEAFRRDQVKIARHYVRRA